MTLDRWTAVDQYFNNLLVPSDPVLDAALQDMQAAGLPAIQVTPNQGKLLSMLAQMIAARTILEIGTLGGYSTIWLARAMQPGGQLITLEANPRHAEIARNDIARAGLDQVVEIRVGMALDTLPKLAQEIREPFDLVFIDADKANIKAYFDWALKLAHKGSLIIIDNVVRNGAIVDPNNRDPDVQGVRRFSTALAAEKRVSAVAIQTVGSKGYDGFAIALVKGEEKGH